MTMLDRLLIPVALLHVLLLKIIEWRGWSRVRVMSARLRGATIGVGTTIERGCYLAGARQITLGDNVYIGPGVYIVAYDKQVNIGNGTLIAAGCRIISRNHRIDSHRKLSEQEFEAKPITIGEDVWLGFNAVILPGVRVGSHSVVAACAVVTRDVEPNTIVAGIPARPISASWRMIE